MCADTGNFAFVEYNDLICSHDRADPLCNNQHGRIGCFGFQRFAKLCVGFKVQCRKAVVKNINRAFFNECACNRQTLFLTA